MTQDYYGTKRVTAWPNVLGDKAGYAVKYEDGYLSWSPKDIFEAAYQPLDKLSFGHALVALEAGLRVQRGQWVAQNKWLFYVKNWAELGGCYGDRPTLPFLALKLCDGAAMAWSASQEDMLAKDWAIVKDVACACKCK